MKKFLNLFLIFLIFSSLALAVSIETDKTDYSQGELVNINVKDCLQISVLQVFNANTPVPDLVDMKQGQSNWQTNYNTNSDSSDGKYMLSASCEDGTTATKYFCVDSPGCTATSQPQPQPQPTPSGGGGGGGGCLPEWSCSYWTICGANLTQTRICYDQKCHLQPKTESRGCEPCDEAWICSAWSTCTAEQQVRECYDEHDCGTAERKPTTQKDCAAAETGPPPVQTIPAPPEQFTPPPTVEMPQPSLRERYWGNYRTWIVAVPSALVFLLLIFFLFMHFYKPKVEVTNMDELEGWVKKEIGMGTPKEKIRGIIHQQTGWTDQELDHAFEDLRLEQPPAK